MVLAVRSSPPAWVVRSLSETGATMVVWVYCQVLSSSLRVSSAALRSNPDPRKSGFRDDCEPRSPKEQSPRGHVTPYRSSWGV